MYRVFLIPTAELPRKEEWVDAHDVRESQDGDLWEFLKEGALVGQISKARVEGYLVAEDRRKSQRAAPARPDGMTFGTRPQSPFSKTMLNL